jgi:hypothetical protein
VFENGVLRKICEPKRKEVTEGWKKLCNEEIHGLYLAVYIFEVINQEDEIGRACGNGGEVR